MLTEKVYLEAILQAWNDIKEYNLYITGTATQGELFFGNHYLPADEKDLLPQKHPWGLTAITMGEGCVTAQYWRSRYSLSSCRRCFFCINAEAFRVALLGWLPMRLSRSVKMRYDKRFWL